MLSTGNDIVALAAIDITRTRQPRFYSKILSASEIAVYSDPQFADFPLEVYVWLLWSVKESAYKYLKRLNPAIIFTPVRFELSKISLLDNWEMKHFIAPQTEQTEVNENAFIGEIIYDDSRLYFAADIYHELIHTVVSDGKEFRNTHFGIRYINDTKNEIQSSSVRDFVTKRLKMVLDADDISIQKDQNGIPSVFILNKKTDIPVSLAHHENWVAFAFRVQ